MQAIDFENIESRMPNILMFLNKYHMDSMEEAKNVCKQWEIPVFDIVKMIQNIAFEDAGWAYVAGSAAVLKEQEKEPEKAALILGEALQAFCVPGTVASERKVGTGHGKLAAMALDESVKCFAFLAGHESFAAAEGALGIAKSANRVRKTPLRVVLNGLGKDAAHIIARMNGFTYVKTKFDLKTGVFFVEEEILYSVNERAAVRCYGANEMREGVEIMKYEQVDVSISGNGTNMVKFQHPVAGAYKKYCIEQGKEYFACASGGGIGRTMNHDDISAGPASYGFTDMMSRMYADATFAGSSSVPAHVEMMGYIGMGNNPMVGVTVYIAAMISELLVNKAL